MPKIYDGLPNFAQGGDSGEDAVESIQPIAGGEAVYDININRSPENLRKRTEVVREILHNIQYYLDYDRAHILSSTGLCSCVEPDPGGDPGRYIVQITQDLYIYPALTPGRFSGGRPRGAQMFVQQGLNWVPYAGILGANDLAFTASALYTGQRGYNDADDFAVDVNGLSLGGNRLVISLVANPAILGGVPNITATVTGTSTVNGLPKTKITITYGTATPTSINDIIAFVNADTTSQTTYGISHLIRASTTSPGVNPPPVITNAVFQGAYDAEAHKITPATLTTFFNAVDGGGNFINRLREGESLALYFVAGPVETGPVAPTGGRRQSIWDLPTDRVGTSVANLAPTVGWNIFNTGREPEKIPGAVPIGKLLGNTFVFIDGTAVNDVPIALGESFRLLQRLLNEVPPTSGATLVGYSGSNPWHPEADGSPHPSLPHSNVEEALDQIVSDLASDVAADSGALRVGIEPVAGFATLSNYPLSTTATSLRGAVDQLLNTGSTETDGGGINTRVSETGHDLKGYRAIHKDLSPATLVNPGGQRFSARLSTTGSLSFVAVTRNGREEFADIVIEPIAVTGTLDPSESVALGSLPNRLLLTSGTIAARYAALHAMFPVTNTAPVQGGGTFDTPVIVVEIVNTPGANGWYFYNRFIPGAPPYEVELRNLDGTVANFAAATFGVTSALVFHNTHIRGNTRSNFFERSYHVASGFAARLIAVAAATNRPWLETHYSDTAAIGNNSIKGSIFEGNRAIWNPTAATPRSTENILGTADKQLLDGVETGVVVDATTNHFHGTTYDRDFYYTAFTPLFTVQAFNAGAPTLIVGVTFTPGGAIPVNHTKKAIRVRGQMVANLTNGGSGGDIHWVLFDSIAPVDGYQGFRQRFNIMRHSNTTPTTVTFQFVGEIPLNSLGQAFVQISTSALINVATSTLTLEEVGAVIYKSS